MAAGRLPDFYVIGAMKAATTTLAAQLNAQPGLFMADPKEPNFFSDDATFSRGMGWYQNLFAKAGADQLCGEASTHYTKWPDLPLAPERLKAATPDAKFIYMLRHPVARARSHAFHEIRKGRGTDLDQIAHDHDGIWAYGCYAAQIERWLAHFPADQFLVVCAERMAKEPESEFSRVLAHLGIEGAWQDALGELHRTGEGYKALPMEKILLDWGPLKTIRRHLIPKSWRNAVRKARAVDTATDFLPETIAMIEDKTGPDLIRFGEMCGVDLSLETYKDVVLREHLVLRGAASI